MGYRAARIQLSPDLAPVLIVQGLEEGKQIMAIILFSAVIGLSTQGCTQAGLYSALRRFESL